MHPPEFRHAHYLSDWPDCHIEVQCPGCKRSTTVPTRLLMQRHGDMLIMEAVKRLKCKTCQGHPAPVYLCASHHRPILLRAGSGLGNRARAGA